MPPGGQSRIITKSEDLILLAPSRTRRIMFFFLFLLLTATMVFGMDFAVDLSGPQLLRTVGYAAVLLVLLGAAGWSTTTSFDRGEGSVEAVTGIFGFAVRRSLLVRIDEIAAVVLQTIIVLNEAPPGGRSGVFGTLFEPRSKLIRLYLETDNGRIRIDEDGSADQLEASGIYFAQFLGVEFRREELG